MDLSRLITSSWCGAVQVATLTNGSVSSSQGILERAGVANLVTAVSRCRLRGLAYDKVSIHGLGSEQYMSPAHGQNTCKELIWSPRPREARLMVSGSRPPHSGFWTRSTLCSPRLRAPFARAVSRGCSTGCAAVVPPSCWLTTMRRPGCDLVTITFSCPPSPAGDGRVSGQLLEAGRGSIPVCHPPFGAQTT